MRETTALGAAIVAGFAIGVWKEPGELTEINREGRMKFSPQVSEKKRNAMYRRWQRAVDMSKGWLSDDEGDKET